MAEVVVKVVAEAPGPNTRSNIEVAKLQTFSEETRKILDFLIVYKLYIRIRIRKATIER